MMTVNAVTNPTSAAVVDKIVVVVNDEVITQREVAAYLIPYYEQYRKEYTGRRLELKMLEAEDEVIEQLIEDKLILSEAKRQGVSVASKDIEAKIKNIKTNFETEDEFRKKMADQNISLSELRDKIRDDIMKHRLIRQVLSWKIMITPIEAREYYDNHLEDYKRQANVRAISMLIKKEKRRRTTDEAHFLMERIKELLKSGQEFEELAREYSEGPHAKEGGRLGLVERGQMREELDNAIFALAEGETSDVIESPLGYHMFKVTEILPEEIIDYETVKDEINDLIHKERVDNSISEWLKELRRDAYISVR